MTWQADNGWQLYCLFLSCGCGFWLALVYEWFNWWRRRARYKLTAALWDAAYVVTASMLAFLFALPLTGGKLRWYILLGIGMGFAACRRTAVPLLRRLYRFLAIGLRMAGSLLKRLLAPVGRLISCSIRNFMKKRKNFFKKRKKSVKTSCNNAVK